MFEFYETNKKIKEINIFDQKKDDERIKMFNKLLTLNDKVNSLLEEILFYLDNTKSSESRDKEKAVEF